MAELLHYKIQMFISEKWYTNCKCVSKMPITQFTCANESLLDNNTPESLPEEDEPLDGDFDLIGVIINVK